MNEPGTESSDDPLARRREPAERLAEAIVDTRHVLGDLDSTRPAQLDLLFYISSLTNLQVLVEELLDALSEFDLHLPPARPTLGKLPNDEHEHRGRHQPQEVTARHRQWRRGRVHRMMPLRATRSNAPDHEEQTGGA